MADPETQIRSDDASGIARILGDVGSAVRGFYDRGGLAGALGMEPWHKKPPLDIAMMFAGGTGLGQLPPQLARTMLANTLRAGRAKQKRQVGPTIYHGSPHKFDWPSSGEHVGTGQGVQTYGWGSLYGAEERGVSETYKKSLARDSDVIQYKGMMAVGANGKPIRISNEWRADLHNIIQYAVDNKMSLSEGVSELRRQKSEAGLLRRFTTFGDIDRIFTFLEDRNARLSKADKGHLYEMTLARQGEEFLDWDKPLSEQSESVRKAIWGLTHDTKNPNYIPMPIPNDAPGYNVYQSIIDMAGSDEAASNVLREAGIPGIRYLDQMSRGKAVVGHARGPTGGLFTSHADAERVLAEERAKLPDQWEGYIVEEHSKGLWGFKDVGKPDKTSNYVLFSNEPVRSVKRHQ